MSAAKAAPKSKAKAKAMGSSKQTTQTSIRPGAVRSESFRITPKPTSKCALGGYNSRLTWAFCVNLALRGLKSENSAGFGGFLGVCTQQGT